MVKANKIKAQRSKSQNYFDFNDNEFIALRNKMQMF
jgi:hypothetical protein